VTSAQIDAVQLSSYRPNSFCYVVDAERKCRLDLSIKYPLLSLAPGALSRAGRLDLFFAYTGIYDFDFQRPSAPLISRLQEPGFFLRLKDPVATAPSWYSLGYFHESNGQVLDRTNYFASTDPHREDLISRGWDFAELGAFQRCLDAGAGRFFGGLDLRYYLPFQLMGMYASEEDVFWDPHGQGIHRSQYDGVRPSFSYLNPWLEATDEFRVGYEAPLHCANQLTIRLRKIPVGLSWFNGYGEYVSRYEAPGNFFAVGLYLH
jgi:outer membrane phospholipase A